MTSCILLSAGQSSRFGSPKALAKLEDETVIERVQHMLVSSLVQEIVIVLGSDSDLIEPYILNHEKVKFVYNKSHNFGQTSSFKIGLQNISKATRSVLLLPVDYPVVSVGTINLLVAKHLEQEYLIEIPSFNGRKGHPPLFDISLLDEFLSLDNGDGINKIAHKYMNDVHVCPVEDSGITSSFNTVDEFNLIQRSFLKNNNSC